MPDREDLCTLTQMIQLGAYYVDSQDEPADQANAKEMQGIMGQLADLIAVEVKDDEPPEPDDMSYV